MRKTINPRLYVAILSALFIILPCSAFGQTSSTDLPSNITLIVPFSAGGGTDTLARVLAPALQDTLQGHPTVRVVNRPGGESITGTNKFVRDDVTDGSKLLIATTTTTFQWLLDVPHVKYSFLKLQPLMIFGTGGVIYVSKKTGINSLADLKNPPAKLKFGGISATGLDLIALLAFDVLKINPKTIFGFGGRGPARLALLRGGVNLNYDTTSAYSSQVEPLAEKGRVVPLMSFGVLTADGEVVRDPNFPDLPTVPEAYKKIYGEAPSGPAYTAYKAFLAAGFSFQKGLWAVSQTPENIRHTIAGAVSKLKDDKDFEKKRANILGKYPIYSGPEIKDALDSAYDIPKPVKQYVFDMLKTKYNVTEF